MESLICNVRDIEIRDRQALEHLLGQSLQENQQLLIQIVNLKPGSKATPTSTSHDDGGIPVLPEWCNVYEGLSDEEIADMDQTILQRADLDRPLD